MNFNLSADPLELKKFLDDALEANRLAINELNRQRDALHSALNGQPHRSDHLIPYAPRIQQAITNGAIAYTLLHRGTPPQSC